MDKKQELELLSLRKELIMHRNKFYALDQILPQISKELSSEWENQYKAMDRTNYELKEISLKIAALEKEIAALG